MLDKCYIIRGAIKYKMVDPCSLLEKGIFWGNKVFGEDNIDLGQKIFSNILSDFLWREIKTRIFTNNLIQEVGITRDLKIVTKI